MNKEVGCFAVLRTAIQLEGCETNWYRYNAYQHGKVCIRITFMMLTNISEHSSGSDVEIVKRFN